MKDGKTLTHLSAHVDQEIRRQTENKGAGTLDQQLNNRIQLTLLTGTSQLDFENF